MGGIICLLEHALAISPRGTLGVSPSPPFAPLTEYTPAEVAAYERAMQWRLAYDHLWEFGLGEFACDCDAVDSRGYRYSAQRRRDG